MRLLRRVFRIMGVIVALAAANVAAHAGLPLETESATIARPGELELEAAAEYQVSRDGSARALPLAVGFALSRRLEIVVEPALYTAIRPAEGTAATGVGDVELTLTGVLRPVTAHAIGIAAPTPGPPSPGTPTEAAPPPDLGGAELRGLLGMSYRANGATELSFGVMVDNSGAVLSRSGISLTFSHL